MAYYDRIADKWHKITGYKGGPFKEHVLNHAILTNISSIQDKTILEIGCGNGYLATLILKRLSGQMPKRIIRTDVSQAQLNIAKKHFHIEGCEYLLLDVYKGFPAEIGQADLVISSMVFNEISDKGLKNGIRECARILADDGLMLTAVLHPDFVEKQIIRGAIERDGNQLFMFGTEGLKLPVVSRSLARYGEIFAEHNLSFDATDIFGNDRFFNEKPKLREIKNTPIALLIRSSKNHNIV